MRWNLALMLFVSFFVFAACDDEPDGDGDADADTDADGDGDASSDGDADAEGKEVPEWEPGELDPDFDVAGLHGFYLIGNALTDGHDELELTVTAPSGTARIDAWIGESYQGSFEGAGGTFLIEISIADLAPGEQYVVLAADESDQAFAGLGFIRSHPLYIVVTNDWDDPDNHPITFERQEMLREDHPDLRMTHFVGPYTFTDPSVSDERREEIVAWLVGMRDEYDDEIGLHIHPYCSFVEAAGLECVTDHSFAYAEGDESGYTIFLSDYDEEESVVLFEMADTLFTDWGLGKPTSFRAGGWTADLPTLRAMARTGYVADTSAVNWSRMEEWEGIEGTELYSWNAEQWATIGETSQPYYPSDSDILSSEPPRIPVLEVPDNGILVDYVSSREMIEIFEANWDGGALAEPRQFSIGYHPSSLDPFRLRDMDGALEHLEQFLAMNDDGPVIYATLSETVLVWPFDEE